MKKTILITLAMLLIISTLSGCITLSKKDRGTLIGAGIGGAAGFVATSSPAGAIGGGIGGAFLGHSLAD